MGRRAGSISWHIKVVTLRLAFPILHWKQMKSSFATASILRYWGFLTRHLLPNPGFREMAKHCGGHLKYICFSIFTIILSLRGIILFHRWRSKSSEKIGEQKMRHFTENLDSQLFCKNLKTWQHWACLSLQLARAEWWLPYSEEACVHFSSSLLCFSISISCMSLQVIPTRLAV